jgi:hypothetical protein
MKDPSEFKCGSFLWITESHDALATLMIIDMPVPISLEHENCGGAILETCRNQGIEPTQYA